ncbi:hypothetical protein AQB9606_04707 [Aquabacterium sp. CECT 9606]|nr:hypothetical protein AQB9606_04707 [Aquabacterium sp. CECT 9606]
MRIGVGGHCSHHGADVRLTQHIGGASRSGIHTTAVPVVGDRAQSIDVGDVVAGRQGLTLGDCAADGHRASGRIVDIGHGGGGRAGHCLRCAMAIGVCGLGHDGGTDIRLTQHIGRAGAARVHPAAVPVVGNRAQAIDVGNIIAGRQRLALRGSSTDAHRPGRAIVDIGHGGGGRAGHCLRCAMAIGVCGLGHDGGTDIRLAQHIGRAGAAGVHTTAVPVVGDRAQAIDVGNIIACRQRLALRGSSTDAHCTGRRIVDVRHRRCGCAGDRF